MLNHVLQKRDIPVAQRNGRELLVQLAKTLHSVRPRGELVPDHAESHKVLLIEEGAVVHKVCWHISLPWEDEFVLDEDIPQRVQMVLIDSLVRYAWITGNRSSELEVGVSPFLSDITPVLLGLIDQCQYRQICSACYEYQPMHLSSFEYELQLTRKLC